MRLADWLDFPAICRSLPSLLSYLQQFLVHSSILQRNYAVCKAIAHKTKANLDSNTDNSHIFSVLISREPYCFPPLLIKQKAHVSFSQPSFCLTVILAVMFSFLCWRQLTSNRARARSLEWPFFLNRPYSRYLPSLHSLKDGRDTSDVTWSLRAIKAIKTANTRNRGRVSLF